MENHSSILDVPNEKKSAKYALKRNELYIFCRAIVNDSAILDSIDESIVKGSEAVERWP